MRPKDERLVNLTLFWKDGCASFHNGGGGRGGKLPSVEAGRTDSERGLGFCVDVGGKPAWNTSGKRVTFVLDREQVEALREYLRIQAPRLRKPAKGGAR